MMKAKRWALFALLALGLAVGAMAVGGALGDPLISTEYLNGTFKPALESQIDGRIASHYEGLNTAAAQKLEQETNAVRERLLGVQTAALDANESYHAAFSPEKHSYQDTITLREGTGLLLLNGAANALAARGELIDLTDGVAAATMTLKEGHRYLASEGSSITVTVQSETARLAVTGYFQSNAGNQNALPFTDISRSGWYFEAVSFVYTQKLFGGMSEDEFWPSYPITRAMLATVLYRMAGTPQSGSGGDFSDVPADSWYAGGISWSASAGVVKGMEPGAFWPNYNVTREQLAVMLHRYASEYLGQDVSQRGDLGRFADRAKVSGWAEEALGWAVGAGILNGDDAGALRPGGSATRAEAATMIQRFAALTDSR